MDLSKPLVELSNSRKVFHSEADFQFALAWKIQEAYPTAKVRLEYCPSCIKTTMHIDILVIIDDDWYPIELKYKTLKCVKDHQGEIFTLKNHGAQDIGRYDFLKDVQRIEKFRRALPKFKKGFSILLTNDPAYWSNSGRVDTVYYQFKISEHQIKTGKMDWASHAGKGTMKGRESSIELEGEYQINWKMYSQLDETRSGTFKYLILPFEVQGNWAHNT